MFEAVVAALFRAVPDEEVCVNDLPTHAAAKKVLVVPDPANSAPTSEFNTENLKTVGGQPVLPAPSMWT
jgi:hypothetical protein